MKIKNGETAIPLPDLVRAGDSITAKWANSMRLAIQRLRDRTPTVSENTRTLRAFPPFWPTLNREADGTLKLTMVEGYVLLRRNETSDAVARIIPSSIPDELTVAVGDKITCRLEETNEGIFTTASVVLTSGDWPESDPPTLKGGDDSTGASGDRHIPLCEIIDDDGFSKVKIWNTGHIDHFQPSLIENVDTSGARVLQKFDVASGMWMLRRLIAGDGVTITENAGDIEVAADGGTGLWAEITFDFQDEVGSDSNTLVATFEAGRLTGLTATSGFITGAGTAGDPYIASHVSKDTDT